MSSGTVNLPWNWKVPPDGRFIVNGADPDGDGDGLAEGDGFVWKVDLDAGDVRKYKIPEKSRKPEADEQAYFAGMKTASASVD